MTTQAEAASAGTIVNMHITRAHPSGLLHGPILAQCAGALAGIGAGGSTAANHPSLYAAWATAVQQASMRAAANGNFADAELLKTAAAVLNNLSLGL